MPRSIFLIAASREAAMWSMNRALEMVEAENIQNLISLGPLNLICKLKYAAK